MGRRLAGEFLASLERRGMAATIWLAVAGGKSVAVEALRRAAKARLVLGNGKEMTAPETWSRLTGAPETGVLLAPPLALLYGPPDGPGPPAFSITVCRDVGCPERSGKHVLFYVVGR